MVGKFPSNYLSELKKLEMLDVSENQLTGSLNTVTIEDITATYVGGGYCLSREDDYYTYFEHRDSVAANGGEVTAEFCAELCRGDKISNAKSNLVGFEIANYGVENFIQEYKEGSGLKGTDCSCLYSFEKLPLPLKDGVFMSQEYTAKGPIKFSDGYLRAVCYGFTQVRMNPCRLAEVTLPERLTYFPRNSTHFLTCESSRQSILVTIT